MNTAFRARIQFPWVSPALVSYQSTGRMWVLGFQANGGRSWFGWETGVAEGCLHPARAGLALMWEGPGRTAPLGKRWSC